MKRPGDVTPQERLYTREGWRARATNRSPGKQGEVGAAVDEPPRLPELLGSAVTDPQRINKRRLVLDCRRRGGNSVQTKDEDQDNGAGNRTLFGVRRGSSPLLGKPGLPDFSAMKADLQKNLLGPTSVSLSSTSGDLDQHLEILPRLDPASGWRQRHDNEYKPVTSPPGTFGKVDLNVLKLHSPELGVRGNGPHQAGHTILWGEVRITARTRYHTDFSYNRHEGSYAVQNGHLGRLRGKATDPNKLGFLWMENDGPCYGYVVAEESPLAQRADNNSVTDNPSRPARRAGRRGLLGRHANEAGHPIFDQLRLNSPPRQSENGRVGSRATRWRWPFGNLLRLRDPWAEAPLQRPGGDELRDDGPRTSGDLLKIEMAGLRRMANSITDSLPRRRGVTDFIYNEIRDRERHFKSGDVATPRSGHHEARNKDALWELNRPNSLWWTRALGCGRAHSTWECCQCGEDLLSVFSNGRGNLCAEPCAHSQCQECSRGGHDARLLPLRPVPAWTSSRPTPPIYLDGGRTGFRHRPGR